MSSILFTLAAVLPVPAYMRFQSIYLAHGSFTAAFSPPIIVVVILGITWKRFSAPTAFAAFLAGGILMGLSIQWPQLMKPPADIHGMELRGIRIPERWIRGARLNPGERWWRNGSSENPPGGPSGGAMGITPYRAESMTSSPAAVCPSSNACLERRRP